MTKIEWAGQTWNPIAGCSVVSPGCTNCYAMRMAARLEAAGVGHYANLTQASKAGPVWAGNVAAAPYSVWTKPLKRHKPTTYFVNSMSDLFHENVPDEWIDRAFSIMAMCPQHTFQVLTKRPKRMREYLEGPWPYRNPKAWPLPNVWLGVSCEDQARADERIPNLLATSAAVRFVSAEPLLGPIDFQPYIERCHAHRDGDCIAVSCPQIRDNEPESSGRGCPLTSPDHYEDPPRPLIDWIIVGGESGPGYRPMNPEWARSIRDQCAAAGTAFFMKQMAGKKPIPDDLLVRQAAIEMCEDVE